MKTWVKSLLLLATTCGYIFLSGHIFVVLEHQASVETHREFTRQVADFLSNHSRCGLAEHRLQDFLKKCVATAHGNWAFLSHANPNGDVRDIWRMSNAFVFAFEVVTTIGSGVLVPRTIQGRLFAMVYAAIGLPFCCLMLSVVGDMCYVMWRKHCRLFYKIRRRIVRLALGIPCTLVVLHTVLSTIPAFLVSWQEGWGFFTAQYYCFMITSTVGLGDLYRHEVRAENSAVTDWCWNAFSILYDLLCLSIVSVFLKCINNYKEHVQMQQEATTQEEQSWADRQGDEISASAHRKNTALSFELG